WHFRNPPTPFDDEETAHHLMRYLVTVVSPRSWSAQGGRGTVEYYPQTNSLVVRQPAEIQEEVAGVLDSLRALQAEQHKTCAQLLKENGCAEQDGEEETSSAPVEKSALEKSLEAPVNLYCKNVSLRELLDDLHAWRGVVFVPDV